MQTRNDSKQKKKVKTNSVNRESGLAVIRNRTHEIYLKRIKNGIQGDADSDWLQAEKELMN